MVKTNSDYQEKYGNLKNVKVGSVKFKKIED